MSMIPAGGDQSFYDSFKANEQKELNPETNSGIKLIQGGKTKKKQLQKIIGIVQVNRLTCHILLHGQ